MLIGEHSAILSSFIMLLFSIKAFVLLIFKWPLKACLTVYFTSHRIGNSVNRKETNKIKFVLNIDTCHSL